MIFIFLLALFASTTVASRSSSYIVVLGDVHKDVEFFTRTFPWIIDNIGGDLIVEYFLLGSGRYSVPQACALTVLYGNTFLQAQYLRCEAKGYPGEYCLCEAGIEPENFRHCVSHGGYIAGTASEKFSSYEINYSPIIDIGSGDVAFGLDDISLLKKICTIYGDNPPRGCIHYSNQTESFLEKKALAQFDRACRQEFPFDDDKPEAETTTEWVTETTTRDWWDTTTKSPTRDWWDTTTKSPTRDWWDTTTKSPTTTTSTSTSWVTPTTSDWRTTTTTTELCNTQPGGSATSPSWSTTSPPWSTTPPSIFTTSPPWSTTSPPWFTTSTPVTRPTPQLPNTTPRPTPQLPNTTPRPTPQLPNTTPRPTQPTLWPTWWPTRTTARTPWPTLWPIQAAPSNPRVMNEEVTEAASE